MADITTYVPESVVSELQRMELDVWNMADEMTLVGAETAQALVRSNIDGAFQGGAQSLKSHVKISKGYITSNGEVCHKVIITGYMSNRYGYTVPAPLVALAREYGTSSGERAKPFFFKAFKKAQIERAMKAIERKYLPEGAI